MRTPALAVSALLILGACTEVWAQAPSMVVCETLEGRRELVDSVIAVLDRAITDRVELVPPSEAEYIAREEAAVFALARRDERAAEARFNLVFDNRFYHAHKLREAIDAFKGSLNWGVTFNDDDGANFIMAIVSAIQGLSDIRAAWTSYLESDKRRSAPIQSEDASMSGAFFLTMIAGDLRDMAECAVTPLRGVGG